MLHSVLCKLPEPLDLEGLICKTVQLFECYPPETLQSWRSISQWSVLKTTMHLDQAPIQTIEEGEMFFKRQASQLKRAELQQHTLETLWRYRRPVGTMGLAVIVGLSSWWLGRGSNPPLAVLNNDVFSAFWQRLQRALWR